MKWAIDIMEYTKKHETAPRDFKGFSHNTTDSLDGLGNHGSIIQSEYTYSNGDVYFEEPFFLVSVDVVDADDDWDRREKGFSLPISIIDHLIDKGVNRILFIDYKNVIYFWTTTTSFLSNGKDKERNGVLCTVLPVQEFDIVYNEGNSSFPIYLKDVPDINIGMIKKKV